VREDLLRDADAAMYRAKSHGRANYAIFDHAMNDQALEHLQLETDLRHALRHNQFELYYQPILNLQSRTVSGVEALVRWNHPKRGLVPPDVFIPMAEETGLIVPIGQWIFREACRVARLWQDEFPQENRVISVNLSARQFAQPHLAQDIAQILMDSGLPPQRLILEITESILMSDAKNTIATLNELKQIGLFLSVDDFGTGYSSLSYLRRFPVSSLKIDRSFISGLGNSSGDTAIVRAIITLAEALGLSVVAEGVETAEQRDQLREFGCEFAQGFLFARPLTWAQLNKTWDHLTEFAW
jgi:EAL domain-containing protein (putative c-di-GMP-specific phosphodiesterase class I)